MPTAYTEDVANGKITSFAQYAMRCARASNATVSMRDDLLDAEIPEFTPPEYVVSSASETRDEAEKVASWTYDVWHEKYEQYVTETTRYRTERLEKIAQIRSRYLAMLDKAKRFVPPSPEYNEFAAFMCSQIQTSIEIDCDTSYLDSMTIERFVNWKNAELVRIGRAADRAAAVLKDEQDRCDRRNEWIRQLRAAVALVE